MNEGTTDNGAAPASSDSSVGAASIPSAPDVTASLEKAAASLEPASSPGQPGGTGKPVQPSTGAQPGQTQVAAPSTGPSTGDAKSTPAPGVPPEERWPTILSNARTEAVAELEKQLGWARQYQSETVQAAVGNHTRLAADPVKFYYDLGQELVQAGLIDEESEPEAELVDPEPDLVTPDGKKKAFSEEAVRALLANQETRIMQKVTGVVKPALDFTQQSQAAREEAAIQSQSREVGDEAIAHMRTLPHFTENQKLIAAEMAKVPPETRRRMGGAIAVMHACYNKIMAEKVLPGLDAAAEARVLERMKRSANGGQQQVVPGGDSATKSKTRVRDGDVDGLAARLAELSTRSDLQTQ